MQLKLENIRVYSKGCIGCENNKRDIMISFMEGKEFHDIFLTQELAKSFAAELDKKINENEE